MMLSYTPSQTSSHTIKTADSSSSSSSSSRMTTRSIVLWYSSMLICALLAGSMDWKMQVHLRAMAQSFQTALRIATIDLLEHVDGYKLEDQAHLEEQEAVELEQKALQLETKSQTEHAFANKTRTRGEYLAKMALYEQEKADELWERAERSEELRVKVLANLTLEEAEEAKTLQHMRAIHQGACNWKLVSSFCDTVGGITTLQQKADAEALLIQTEWRQAAALGRQERLQEFVAALLQNKAQQFNDTAQDLLHVANLWDEHAQAEWTVAMEMNETAVELKDDAQHKEEQAAKAEKAADADGTDSEEAATVTRMETHQYLHHAQVEHIYAYWCAIVAMVLGFCALVYFVCTAAPRAVEMLEDSALLGNNGDDDDMATWQSVSYVVLHVFFFLTVIGMTGVYFEQLMHYNVGQRAVLIVWFAFLGSTFQTFFLHAVPRFLVEARAPVPDLPGFVLHLVIKSVVVFSMYTLEVLFLWLSLGQALFAPTLVNVVNSLVFCLLTVALSLTHAWYFDKLAREQQHNDETDSVTVWRCSDNDDEESTIASRNGGGASVARSQVEASETTPLCKEELLSVGTVLDLNAVGVSAVSSQEQPQDASTNNNSNRLPRVVTMLQEEFYQLLLPFEILVIASMVAVLRNCLHTVWSSQATVLQCAVLVCASILVVWGAVLVKDLTCEDCYEMSHGRRRRTSRHARKKGVNDAVELVEV